MDAVFSALRALLTSKVMLLAVGGALGTNARYWLAALAQRGLVAAHGTWLSAFRLGTFVINVTGSFVLGLVGIVFLERLPEHREWFLFLGTGLCGGYTTFSTFEWETLQLLRDGSWMMATVERRRQRRRRVPRGRAGRGRGQPDLPQAIASREETPRNHPSSGAFRTFVVVAKRIDWPGLVFLPILGRLIGFPSCGCKCPGWG